MEVQGWAWRLPRFEAWAREVGGGDWPFGKPVANVEVVALLGEKTDLAVGTRRSSG